MKRSRLAVLALGAALAVPAVVAAESPALDPSQRTICITIVGDGSAINPFALMQSIKNGDLEVTGVDPTCGGDPVATPAPTVAAPIESIRPLPSFDGYKKLTSRQWQQLMKDPEAHWGEAVQVWACISDFDASTSDTIFWAMASYKRQAYWYSNGHEAVFGTSGGVPDLTDFVNDDVVLMNATVLGAIDNGSGGTVPGFEINSIERRGDCS